MKSFILSGVLIAIGVCIGAPYHQLSPIERNAYPPQTESKNKELSVCAGEAPEARQLLSSAMTKLSKAISVSGTGQINRIYENKFGRDIKTFNFEFEKSSGKFLLQWNSLDHEDGSYILSLSKNKISVVADKNSERALEDIDEGLHLFRSNTLSSFVLGDALFEDPEESILLSERMNICFKPYEPDVLFNGKIHRVINFVLQHGSGLQSPIDRRIWISVEDEAIAKYSIKTCVEESSADNCVESIETYSYKTLLE